jgi:hypothetical protein
MPGLRTLLQTTPSDTREHKDLRASCISTMGSIFASVKDQPEVCMVDAHAVMQSFV